MQNLDQVHHHKPFPILHQYTHGPHLPDQMVLRTALYHHHYTELLESSHKI